VVVVVNCIDYIIIVNAVAVAAAAPRLSVCMWYKIWNSLFDSFIIIIIIIITTDGS